MEETNDTTKNIIQNNIIILHPGSLHIRFGLVADATPKTETHVIARKRRPGGHVRVDRLFPPDVLQDKELPAEIEVARLQIEQLLECEETKSSGKKRFVTPSNQIAAYNRRVIGQVTNTTGVDWKRTNEDIVVGNDAVALAPELEYNVHFPIQRGELNLNNIVGGSLPSVLEDLSTIWTRLITDHLNVQAQNFKNYRCILVISHILIRKHLKELMTLLLTKMNFEAAFLVQEDVAATFGAGMGYACVVDVGHSKVAVSCVEDGLSAPQTRVRFGFGGADMTQVFGWLLRERCFPYTCDPIARNFDALLMQSLKHDFCHINLDVCGSYEKTFILRQPDKPVQRFTIQVGDECIMAVLAFFQPELMTITGPKTVLTQIPNPAHPEDFLGPEYIKETGRKCVKDVLDDIPANEFDLESTPMDEEEECVVDKNTGNNDCITSLGDDKTDKTDGHDNFDDTSTNLDDDSNDSKFSKNNMSIGYNPTIADTNVTDSSISSEELHNDEGILDFFNRTIFHDIDDGQVSLQACLATFDDELLTDSILSDTPLSSSSSSDFLSENGHPIGIDLAISRSIERYGGSEESRRKFFTAILLVGAGLKFPGITEYLERRISKLISTPYKTEPVEVTMSPKDVESEHTAWKGAAVIAGLEGSLEIWISSEDWNRRGIALLREKAVFTW